MTVEFSLPELNKLVTAAPEIAENVKDLKACQTYIAKYMYPLTNGRHVMLIEGKFVQYDQSEIKKTFFARMDKKLSTWYFTKYDQLYTLINDVHAPVFENNKINLCPGIKWKTRKPFASFSDDIKKRVHIFLAYMKEVLCSQNEKCYIYLLKWYSWVCKGKKNDSAIYFKGPEGVGKSTMIDMFVIYVLGTAVCIKPSTECLTTGFNKQLCGKVFVPFEELSTFSEAQWKGVSSKLKDMITGEDVLMVYRDLYEKPFEAKNINNYNIITNVEAIKCSQGRRYFIAPLNTRHMNDYAYFGNIKKQCFNEAVGEALYNFFMEVDTTDYNAQKDMPETDNKLAAIADRLDIVYKFIKDTYILARKGIDCKVTELYTAYCEYCSDNGQKALSNHKFYARLREICIDYKKIHGSHIFRYTAKELKAIADKHKWIHELDEFTVEEPKPVVVKNFEKFASKDPLDNGIETTELAVEIIEEIVPAETQEEQFDRINREMDEDMARCQIIQDKQRAAAIKRYAELDAQKSPIIESIKEQAIKTKVTIKEMYERFNMIVSKWNSIPKTVEIEDDEDFNCVLDIL